MKKPPITAGIVLLTSTFMGCSSVPKSTNSAEEIYRPDDVHTVYAVTMKRDAETLIPSEKVVFEGTTIPVDFETYMKEVRPLLSQHQKNRALPDLDNPIWDTAITNE